jgi:hypothetical protein
MSEVIIKNAATGDTMQVTPKGYAKVVCVSENVKDHACDTGIEQKYNINTGDITLTNDTKTSVLYVKNESRAGNLVIESLIFNLGNTAGGSGDVKIDVIKNPTTGDIIDNANNVLVGAGIEANQNFGSANSLVGKFYKGATGETVFSDGDVSVTTRSASNTGRIVVSLGAVVLPRGTSLGLDYTPPTGNTSQTCQFALSCYLATPDVGEP